MAMNIYIVVVSVWMASCLHCHMIQAESDSNHGLENEITELSKNSVKDSPILEIDNEQFEDFVKAPEVRIVYFYTIDFKRLKNFMREMQTSAKLLETYNVKVGKVNCPLSRVHEYCSQANVHNRVYAFKNGNELLVLPLENMFDVNSILSNILQLVLLREVPIIQTKEERIDFESQQKGKFDVIFSFQRAIGTYEHRMLMEIAYTYHTQFHFALTTEEETIDDFPERDTGEEAMVWVGRCTKVMADTPCLFSKYHDAMDHEHFSSFLSLLNIPLMHDIESNDVENPLADFNIHVAVLYYDTNWKEMVQEVATKIADSFPAIMGIIMVNMEKVDGLRYGFLSELNSIPGLAFFVKNRQHPSHMEAVLSEETALRFIKSELETYKNKLKYGDQKPKIHKTSVEEDSIAEVERQDDAVAEAMYQLRKTQIIREHLPALTDKTFPQETTSRDFLMVLFYLTFDARSMAFLRSYAEAAEALAAAGMEHLAAVDCYDWTDVCGKQNVTSYPLVRIYRKGSEFTTYTGMLDAQAVINTVKLLQVPAPTYLTGQAEVTSFIEGNLPVDFVNMKPTVVLGLFTAKNKQEMQAFMEASKVMQGKFITAYTSGDVSLQIAKSYNSQTPCIIVLKKDDEHEPHKVIKADASAARLVQAVDEAALHVLPELKPSTFPAYYKKGLPLVLLFVDEEAVDAVAMATMSRLASSPSKLPVTFCWIKVKNTDPLNVGYRVLMDYNPAAQLPALAFVNHHTGHVYNLPLPDFSEEAVLTWVKAVLNGEIQPSKSMLEGQWKPLNPGYDFLAMIDEENESQRETDRLRLHQRHHDIEDELEMPTGSRMKDPMMQDPVMQEPMATHTHTEL